MLADGFLGRPSTFGADFNLLLQIGLGLLLFVGFLLVRRPCGRCRKEPDRRTGVHGVDEQLRELGYRRAEALGGQDLDRAFWGRTENLADSSSGVASATDEFSADPGLCC